MAVRHLSLGGTAASLLFERLPEKIFAPLASPNRETYWGILCALYSRRFGPDAPLPPTQGFSTREVTKEIEGELVIHDAWIEEDETVPETPLNIRAITIFNRLLDCGWLRLNRHGVDKRVSMTPAVNQFLGQLVNFAETGPIFVAGKVRSIEANLRMVIMDGADPSSFAEAAEQARNLIEHIRNTGTNIRDLMDTISGEEKTAEYVRRFFSDFVEQVFIGDYKELRTREHPLSRRTQILQWVEGLIASNESRERMIAWYETRRFNGDRARAERVFARDTQKLLDIQHIDEYLERLDEEIRRANRRALAYLDYRLRSQSHIDLLVDRAITRIINSGKAYHDTPFAAGEMVSPTRLAEPRRIIPRPSPSEIRRVQPTIEAVARARLLSLMREVRSLDKVSLTKFVSRQLNGKPSLSSTELVLESVADVRAYQGLLSLRMAIETGSPRLQADARSMMPGFTIKPESNDRQDVVNKWISGRPFVIEKRERKAQRGTSV